MCLLDTLKGVCIAGEKMLTIQGDSSQFLNWEQYGLRITVPQGTLCSTVTTEVAITALVGGQFQLPEGTELISAVYALSVSKPLLKPIQLEIQHCADLVSQDHTSYLNFATASVNVGLPYQFQLKEGGQFNPGDQYGSICLSQFSLWAIVKYIKRLLGYPTSSESSSDDELPFVDASATLETSIKPTIEESPEPSNSSALSSEQAKIKSRLHF